ncbi:unnamed protein product [Caenorhabditis auriculariae]|uniref:Uncharacterized protein n=1 Tax=Caenorhabditis auriculariae TaxID=2777116 RepID=A0A8S1H6T7_9PELO|nr:unnamed protein product [Caenorhabditis auriculariae]
MSDAKSTLAYVNGLILLTINEAEKTLLSLPARGDRAEVETATSKQRKTDVSRTTADVVVRRKNSAIRDKFADEIKPLSLSPRKETATQQLSTRTRRGVQQECAASRAAGVKVLGDKVKVTPLESSLGVVIEMTVELHVPSTGELRVVAIEIECPKFVPTRIRVDGKWKNIA